MKTKVVLLHGAMGSMNQWVALMEKLMPRMEVYAFDFSGHGTNTAANDFSIDLFVSDTLVFLDQHQIEKVDIFGYSMGGYVALAFAKKYPERVKKIITLATKFNWTPEMSAREVNMLIPETIEEKIPKFAEELQKRHYPNDWKIIVRKTAVMMTGLGHGKALKPDDFSSIPHEVLICVGADDKMVTFEESQTVAGYLKNGTFMAIPGFKHPIESNDKTILADLIFNYLEGKGEL